MKEGLGFMEQADFTMEDDFITTKDGFTRQNSDWTHARIAIDPEDCKKTLVD